MEKSNPPIPQAGSRFFITNFALAPRLLVLSIIKLEDFIVIIGNDIFVTLPSIYLITNSFNERSVSVFLKIQIGKTKEKMNAKYSLIYVAAIIVGIQLHCVAAARRKMVERVSRRNENEALIPKKEQKGKEAYAIGICSKKLTFN